MTNLIIEEMSDTKSMVDFVIDGKKYCVMKNRLKSALVECKIWQFTGGTNFTCKLFDLIAKADDYNKLKILLGFPAEMCAYLMWFHKSIFGVKCDPFTCSDIEFFNKAFERLNKEF